MSRGSSESSFCEAKSIDKIIQGSGCTDLACIKIICQEVFVKAFSKKSAGPLRSYTSLAKEIQKCISNTNILR